MHIRSLHFFEAFFPAWDRRNAGSRARPNAQAFGWGLVRARGALSAHQTRPKHLLRASSLVTDTPDTCRAARAPFRSSLPVSGREQQNPGHFIAAAPTAAIAITSSSSSCNWHNGAFASSCATRCAVRTFFCVFAAAYFECHLFAGSRAD
jgi:hypothetical protein